MKTIAAALCLTFLLQLPATATTETTPTSDAEIYPLSQLNTDQKEVITLKPYKEPDVQGIKKEMATYRWVYIGTFILGVAIMIVGQRSKLNL